MTIFCDTSVLVAASVAAHEHFPRAEPILRQVKDKVLDGCVAAHSLAETYAVLTTLPITPRIHPLEAERIVQENVVQHFTLIILTGPEYSDLITEQAQKAIIGGAVYDSILLRCARKSRPDRIYTFNVAQFKRLAPDLSAKITAP